MDFIRRCDLYKSRSPEAKVGVYHNDFIQKFGYFIHLVLETLSIRNNLVIFVSR